MSAAISCPVVRDDAQLLDAWRAGDRDAGDELVRRHFDSVFRFFSSKLGDDVQDIIQRTFLDCVKSRERVIGKWFRRYLFGIARHRLIDELRRRGGEQGFDPATSSLPDPGFTPSQAALRSEEIRLLRRALRRLALDHQIAIELFYWEQMATAEIAHVLDVSEHTVRSRLSRARDRLRVEVQRLASSPALAASTVGGLETWARRVGELIKPPADH